MDKQREEILPARVWLEANEGKIMNAFRFTELDVWDRVDFDELLRKIS